MGRFATRQCTTTEGHAAEGYPARPDDMEEFPTLVEFLSLTRYEDGTPRLTGSLIIFVEDGRLKVMLNDKAEGMVGFRVVERLDGLLRHLDQVLRDDLVEWRRTREPGGKPRR